MINGTKLSPLEEALFKSWAMANGVQNHDDPKNQFDHRGLYKSSNGAILPPGVVTNMEAAHNKAMEPQEGGDMTFPDPYMAQAEMHGNQLKAEGDRAKLDHAFKLEDVKHQHKLELEKMKLEHKSQQAEVDRQHQQVADQQARQDNAMQAHQDRQMQADQFERSRQHDVQDQQASRQAQIEDTQRAEQSGLRSTLVKGMLDQQRPQPTSPGGEQPGNSMAPAGRSPGAHAPVHPPGMGGLEHQLAQRQNGGF